MTGPKGRLGGSAHAGTGENSIRMTEDDLDGYKDDSDLRLTYIVRRPTLTPTICTE